MFELSKKEQRVSGEAYGTGRLLELSHRVFELLDGGIGQRFSPRHIQTLVNEIHVVITFLDYLMFWRNMLSVYASSCRHRLVGHLMIDSYI